MGRCIAAVDHGGQRYYLEWSTVVDAPVSRGMILADFLAHYAAEYGRAGLRNVAERIDRADKCGTSSRDGESFAELIAGNHAGEDGTELTREQIVDHYILGKPLAKGTTWNPDDDDDAREFPLGTVLTISDGRFVDPDGIGGLYEILNFMTGDNLYTHQLPRGMRECKPDLLRQHPVLADIRIKEILDTMGAKIDILSAAKATEDVIRQVVADAVETIATHVVGAASLRVRPLPIGDHVAIDPIREAVEQFGGRVVVVEDGGEQ